MASYLIIIKFLSQPVLAICLLFWNSWLHCLDSEDGFAWLCSYCVDFSNCLWRRTLSSLFSWFLKSCFSSLLFITAPLADRCWNRYP